MTEEEIEGIIRNTNAMGRIATGVEPDEEQDEIDRRMLRGEITLEQAIEEGKKALFKKWAERDGRDNTKQ